ncbi:hypothetical protein OC846_006589 [Tilletia horrida]|uniref:Uncharacterized protein n=1 Tax=Tilletia horrida TaxID=155126 RepID=A0AAN6GIJ5_9BASI|nr:hypothetical protein OC846_006589 [Tilletia horrida]KAK0559307.1 hypothetical protein OC861_006686 [Tilletia horrida]
MIGPNVRFDGELMHQMVPCMPLSCSRGHCIARGFECSHLVFAVGKDGELWLLRPDGFNGQYSLLDLRPAFGLATSVHINALAVSQDIDDRIYIAFAYAGNKLHVLKPLIPEFLEGLSTSSDLTSKLLSGGTALPNGVIEKLYIGDTVEVTSSYPALVAIYDRLDRPLKEAAHVKVDQLEWKWQTELQLPENPRHMLDMACGTLPNQESGFFYLYKIENTTALTFCSTTSPGVAISLQVPQGATSLATFVNKDGHTDLLVGSLDKICHYTSFNCCMHKLASDPPVYTTISSDSEFLAGVHHLFVAPGPRPTKEQMGDITVFFRNDAASILYQSFDIEVLTDKDPDVGDYCSVSARSQVTPLLTAERGGGTFAATIDPATGSRKLFVNDLSGTKMTLLEQSSVNKLWQQLSVLVPSTGVNEDVPTFTSHVKIYGPKGELQPKQKVLLKASSPVELAVNGITIRVTTVGVPVETDYSSSLTIIHNISDISTVSLTITDVPGAPEKVVRGSVTFDPSQKVQEKIRGLGSIEGLKCATLENGEKLVDANVPHETLEFAASALSKLGAKMDELGSSKPLVANAAVGSSWGFWHFLSSIADKIKSWAVQGWEFIVETAGKVYKFVLESVGHVMKAMSWVFEKIKVGFNKLVEFVKFVFAWDDILDTRTILVRTVNFGIDGLSGLVNVFAGRADAWFEQLDQKIASMDTTALSKHSAAIQKPEQNAESEAQKALDSPGGNWSGYQLQHGDVGKSFKGDIKTGDSVKYTDPISQKLWKEVIQPCFKSVEQLFDEVGQLVTSMLNPRGDVDTSDLFKHFGVQMLRKMVNILRTLMVGIIKLGSVACDAFKLALNTRIEIPVLSALYRKIANGQDLSLIDAICLLLAIPATIVYKVVKQERPRDNEVFKQVLDGDFDKIDFSFLQDWIKHGKVAGDAVASTGATLWNVGKLVVELSLYAPVIGAYSAIAAPAEWFKQDLAPQKWGPLDSFVAVLKVLGALSALPVDSLNPLLPTAHQQPRLPGIEHRVQIWTLDLVRTLCTITVKQKVPLHSTNGVVASLQLAPVVSYIASEVEAGEDRGYAKRDQAVVGFSSAVLLFGKCSVIANALNAVQHGIGPLTPVTVPAAIVLNGIMVGMLSGVSLAKLESKLGYPISF